MRRFIHVPLIPFIIICGVAAGGYAVGGYLLYRLLFPQTTDMSKEPSIDSAVEYMVAPLRECLDMVRREDDYALFTDNQQRIANWCKDNKSLFREYGRPQPPPRDEMTKAEEKEMITCIGHNILQGSPPEPHRTIEDVFDTVRAIQFAKDQCYHDAYEAWKAKTSKSVPDK